MNLKSIFVLFLVILVGVVGFNAEDANAQERELKSGLNYTAIYNKPKPTEVDAVKTPEAPAAPEISATPTSTEVSTPLENEEITRIWNKYKALATGKASTETQAENENAKTTLEDTQSSQMKKLTPATALTPAPAAAPAPASSTGIAGILQEWKASKAQQSEIRSKSFKVPEIPEKNTKP